MTFENEHFLITAIRGGDTKAFEYTFKVYYPRLRNFAMQYLKDEDCVRDILQEAFARLYENRTSFVGNSISSIIFTIVRNLCLNELKHRTVVEEYENRVQSAITGEELYNTDLFGQADRKILYQELLEQVTSILSELPERSREVFDLSHVRGLKNKEIAEQLQISVKAVEKHLTRVRKLFASRIGKEHLALAMLIYLNHIV